MARINTYLTFNGNCREAMNFYRDCLGGKLSFQTVGESPLSSKMPVKMKNCILHATLLKGDLILQATDMTGDSRLSKGNSVSLLLDCNSEREIRTFYHKLSSGGQQTHPLEVSFWGAILGNLIDKYDHHWLLHYDKNKS